MRPDPQGRLLRLEQRLSTFNQVAPSTSRSTALDILTGRVADQHLGSPSTHRQHAAAPLLTDSDAAVAAAATRLHPRVTYLTARAFLDSGDAVHAHESTTVRPLPAWAGPRDEASPRLRLRPTRGTPRLSLFVRVLVLALGAMCVVAAAGFEVLAFTGGPDLSSASVVLATASPDAATSPPAVVSMDSAYAVDSIVPTLVPSPSVPVPASSMGLLVDERFTSNAANWPNDAHGTAWLADGAYRLSARQAAHFVAVSIPNTRDLGDAVVTAW
ncbi:MAG TPA: hypothetical protein VF937_07120, partial [Chloroflexota bacterium]